MAVEKALIERIGAPGEKLHTGRSRNDQVTLDMRMYLRDEIDEIRTLLEGLRNTLLELAKREKETVMPGYTHLQRAQPVLLAHYLLAFDAMFARDDDRFQDCLRRTAVMPLGAAALAGTGLPLDRHFTASLLDFPAVSSNSMDTVADRDYVAEFIFVSSLLMMHLSRLCEDLVIWSSSEFGFVEIADAYTTGSSIMPQKKNPDVAELIRGRTGRVYGSLVQILTVLKGLPMTYNRDLQEDKEALFDTVDTVKSCLALLGPMLIHTTFKRDRMVAEASGGFAVATDLAEYLVLKGMPFRESHAVVGRLVGFCLGHQKDLTDLTLEEFQRHSMLFDQDVFALLQPMNSIDRKSTTGGTSRRSVQDQIEARERERCG
jgi:argininosuccinate lyase